MKKSNFKLNICLLLITMFSFFAGQVHAQKKAEIGFRYMPTLTDFKMHTSSGGEVSGEAVLGYGIGAFLGINFTNHVGFQGEIIYNSLSQKYSEQGSEVNVKLKYINIPLLL